MGSRDEHDSPSTATCPQDDYITLVHFKVDIHENRITFWPETGEVLHSNQRSHRLYECSHREPKNVLLNRVVILTQTVRVTDSQWRVL